MRQFAYFGTWNDSWAVLDAIEQLGMFSMVPDLWYEEPKPLLCRHVEDSLKAMLRERPRVFLWSEAFASAFPPLRRQRSGPMSGRYQIPVGIGVPLLELVLPGCYERNGLLNLAAGDLAASSVVVNPETQQEEPGTEVLAGFELVRSRMKQVLKRHKMKRWIWIGPDALHLVQERTARITSPNV